MNKIIKVWVLTVLFGCLGVFGQDDVSTPNRVRQPATIEQIRARDFERRRQELARISDQPRERSIERAKPLTKEEIKQFKEATDPDPEDLVTYKELLKQPDTGIFRLHPDFDCESRDIVRVDGKCAGFVPGTWAYSLRKDEYSGNEFHDLALKGGEFVTRGLLNQGILVRLGDLPLEEAGSETAGIRFLRDFKPGTTKDKAGLQYRELSGGIPNGNFRYVTALGARKDMTYGLRVVAYRFLDKWRSRFWSRNLDQTKLEGILFQQIAMDKRNDSLFVFRVIRQADDGSLTILWKRLDKLKSPKLVYGKDEPLRDFRKL